MGAKGGRVFRNMYKGHMDKTKEGRIKGEKWGWLGSRVVVGRKWRQLYLSNNKNISKKILMKIPNL